jgi:hypothetical protein
VTAHVVGDRKKWYRRLLRFLIRVSLMLLVVVTLLGWLVYRSAQFLPEFYQSALAVDEDLNATQGDVFETKLLDLQNDARSKTKWQATFSEAEVNGWLASDLLEKFPESLPENVLDPRIAISPNRLNLAVRLQSPRLSAVVVAEVDVFVTEVPGQIAIRIEYVRAGWIPIPVTRIADQLAQSLRRSRIRVSWTEMEGVPVALLTLPPDLVKLGNSRVELESIQLLEDTLVLTGVSIEEKNPD